MDHRWSWGLRFYRLGEGNYSYLLILLLFTLPTKRDEAGEDIASSRGMHEKAKRGIPCYCSQSFRFWASTVFGFSFFLFSLSSLLLFYHFSPSHIHLSPHLSNLNLCSIYPGQKSVHSTFMFIFVLSGFRYFVYIVCSIIV